MVTGNLPARATTPARPLPISGNLGMILPPPRPWWWDYDDVVTAVAFVLYGVLVVWALGGKW